MVEQNNNLVLFSGTSNVSLSEKVAQELGKNLGDAYVGRFSDDDYGVCVCDCIGDGDGYYEDDR